MHRISRFNERFLRIKKNNEAGVIDMTNQASFIIPARHDNITGGDSWFLLIDNNLIGHAMWIDKNKQYFIIGPAYANIENTATYHGMYLVSVRTISGRLGYIDENGRKYFKD